MNIDFKLIEKLTDSTEELLESNLIYLDENIVSFKILSDKIELVLKEDTNTDELFLKIEKLIQKLKPQKIIEANVKFTNKSATASYRGDAYSEMVKNRDVFSLQDGIVALAGLPLHMFEVLDEALVSFAKTQKAKKMLLPITVNFKDLLDSHYFDRTPQHANFLSTIEESTRSITDFSKAFKNKKLIEKDLLKTPHSMCRSAVCLNCYPTMRDVVFEANETRVITAEGRVFRHEYKKVNSLERLYEFSCREIIYIGSKEFVKEKLSECEQWFISFIKEFNLNGIIKSATDPFFMENARALQFYQAAEDSKYEIRILNPFTETDVSIGSLNFHGNHFSKSYNIKFESDEYVSTGCVGFGLERTVFTVLSQYGLETSDWPTSLKIFFKIDKYEK